MRRKVIFRRAVLASTVALLALAPGLALAAHMTATNAGGGSSNPQEGSNAETGWNPIVRCRVESAGSIWQLLECLAMGIDPSFPCRNWPTTPAWPGGSGYSHVQMNQPSPECNGGQDRSDYRVTLLTAPRAGLQIERLDGGEVYSLFLRENDPVIQWTTLDVQRARQVARIHEIVGTPHGGSIRVYLNGENRFVEVITSPSMQASDVTRALKSAIAFAGFSVRLEGSFIVVDWDRIEDRCPTFVGFLSLDDGIVESELRLEPEAGPPSHTIGH